MVLAAGRSSRMSGGNKLLEELGGRAIVARAVDALLAAGAEPILVVTGHDAARVERALARRPVRTVRNPRPDDGMGASLTLGVVALERLGPPPDGVLVALGDMPHVAPEDVQALVRAFEQSGPQAIAVPVHAGRRGHPVLFGASHLAALRRLEGDRGARAVLDARAPRVVEVPVHGRGVLVDVDTREELEALRADLPRKP